MVALVQTKPSTVKCVYEKLSLFTCNLVVSRLQAQQDQNLEILSWSKSQRKTIKQLTANNIRMRNNQKRPHRIRRPFVNNPLFLYNMKWQKVISRLYRLKNSSKTFLPNHKGTA
jgi:hypothetical protein